MAKRAGKLARRYARALLAVAQRELGNPADLQAAATHLAEFAEFFETNRAFQQALLSPMYPREGRLNALRESARVAGAGELLERALVLLFERDRLAFLPEIARAFSVLANEVAKLVEVEIVVAKDLEAAERARTEEQLRRTISGNPQFSWKIAPEILGGMILNYGGRVVDGSISGRLTRLERELSR